MVFTSENHHSHGCSGKVFQPLAFLPGGLLILSGNSTPNGHPKIYTPHSERTLARCVHGRVRTPWQPAMAFAVRGALTFSRNRMNIMKNNASLLCTEASKKIWLDLVASSISWDMHCLTLYLNRTIHVSIFIAISHALSVALITMVLVLNNIIMWEVF